MNALDNESLIRALSWRYATKRFDPVRKISAEDWETLEEALVLSPSSFGLQPWKFLVVQDVSLRTRIREVAWNQPQLEEASHVVVFCAKTTINRADIERHIARIAQVRRVDVESLREYQSVIGQFVLSPAPDFSIAQWTIRQIYLSLGMLLTASAALGIDACPMEGFDPKKVDGILELPSRGLHAAVICALGYRSAEDGYALAKKVRFDKHEVIEHV
jgi:nitroreductase